MQRFYSITVVLVFQMMGSEQLRNNSSVLLYCDGSDIGQIFLCLAHSSQDVIHKALSFVCHLIMVRACQDHADAPYMVLAL